MALPWSSRAPKLWPPTQNTPRTRSGLRWMRKCARKAPPLSTSSGNEICGRTRGRDSCASTADLPYNRLRNGSGAEVTCATRFCFLYRIAQVQGVVMRKLVLWGAALLLLPGSARLYAQASLPPEVAKQGYADEIAINGHIISVDDGGLNENPGTSTRRWRSRTIASRLW